MRRLAGQAWLLLPLVIALICSADAAMAEEPFRVPGQITDQVGALNGGEDEVRSALDRLQDRDRVQLWLVYVDSFSGINAQDWADETATTSGLGLNDVLLAVATGDRAFAYSVDQDFPLSDAQLAEVATVAIEPALAKNDWAAAAIGAATGISESLNGQPVTEPEIQAGDPTPSRGSGASWAIWGMIGLVVLGGVGLFLMWRRRRPGGKAPVAPARAGATRDEYEALSLRDLRKRASGQLVEMDDAIRTSDQELAFAVAEFGEEQTAPFSSTLEAARAEVAEAFRLQQQLDDAQPEDEASTRSILIEICRRTDAASDRLDAEAARFDELRKLEKNAPTVLSGLDRKLSELAEQIPRAAATLAKLSARYSPAAIATVGDNVDQARERLQFARHQVAAGEEDVKVGKAGRAAVAARAAEEGTGQARQLLDAVFRLERDLSEAGGKFPAAIAETERDLAEAEALGHAEALAAPVAQAQRALDAAKRAAAPEGGEDPLGALRRLEDAGRALDLALQRIRDVEQQKAKARSALEQALLAARSQIAATADFITTRRGAVGPEARTRLAEAQRHFDRAASLSGTDPVTALHEASAADSLAQQAQHLAQSDLERYPGVPAGRRSGNGTDWGAILGGILLGSVLGGGRGGGFGGGGFGFPGGGAGRRRGGFRPGSFGGRGTRGRRGSGGRF